MEVIFPAVFDVDIRKNRDRIRRIAVRSYTATGVTMRFQAERSKGFLFKSDGDQFEVFLSIKGRSKQLPQRQERVLQIAEEPVGDKLDLGDAKWIRHPEMRGETQESSLKLLARTVYESWNGEFNYLEEGSDGTTIGLRSPQLGAIHALQAHWALGDSPATIVLPTGTGKTETMLALLVSKIRHRLLVIVPTDALREQLFHKFLTLGILGDPDCKVIGESAKLPIVCALQNIPRSREELEEVVSGAQVVITTSSVAAGSPESVQDYFSESCGYLFIDEAHHAEARTWKAFKDRFHSKRVVQFTATPFREDGKNLDGTIVFRYPLKKAQEEGYFKPITFLPVMEFERSKADKTIAEAAVEQLRKDHERGHVLMARVESIARAREVFAIYEQYEEFSPVELHSGVAATRRRENRDKIINKVSRIVVCVDMLGEGFDLPELKIAAFHDIKKTLPVTLQLAGRFTRARSDLGNATFVANTADVHVTEELRKLYARDPDWNALLPQLSDRMIDDQISLQEFLRGFQGTEEEVSLEALRPAVSTVVYSVLGDVWRPENAHLGIQGWNSLDQKYSSLNDRSNTLVIVTGRRSSLVWSPGSDLVDFVWDLYIVMYFPNLSLIFINGSSNAGDYKKLAEALTDGNVRLISGTDVFRSFHGVNRLRLQNVGLTEQLGKNVSYTGRMGADVESALTSTQLRTARKSVLQGSGFKDGRKFSIGASRKGRIWSVRRERIDVLKKWCEEVGQLLLNSSIDPDEILKGTLDTHYLDDRPSKMPIGIDWPEEIVAHPHVDWVVSFGDSSISTKEADIELVEPSPSGALKFRISTDEIDFDVELELYRGSGGPNYKFICESGGNFELRKANAAAGRELSDFLYEYPPVIWFSDGSSLEGNQYVELKSRYEPYQREKIVVWEWGDDLDLGKESQGEKKDQSSIQARAIRQIKKNDYDVIFDDDGKGEAADIVAIRRTQRAGGRLRIEVEFYHCKYSSGAIPGKRIGDLYEVCGQAQKSISWMSSDRKTTDLFTHLLRREARRKDSGKPTRFESGDSETLQSIREDSIHAEIKLTVYVVQPGLSRAIASTDQLELLSVTQNHLMETYRIEFGVVASK